MLASEAQDRYDPLALIENPGFAPTHWRIVRPFTRMRQCGIDAKFFWQNEALIPTNSENTILVVQQQTGPSIEVAKAWLDERRPMVKAIVYETDDDVFTEDQIEHLQSADWTQGKSADQIRQEQEVARWFAKNVDGVTVSTERLAELIRGFSGSGSGSDNVYVVPNALDVRWFKAHMLYSPPWKDTFTIGWAGGRRSERDIVPMAQAWGRIAQRYDDVMFVVCAPTTVTAIYRYVPESRIIRLPWLGLADYPAAYQVNVGCCPLRDTTFNHNRSPIKAWEYAIAGAEVVASPTVYRDCCINGTGRGYFVPTSTADEWEYYLDFLVRSRKPRNVGDVQLQRHVEQNHNLDIELHRWQDAYAAIASATEGSRRDAS